MSQIIIVGRMSCGTCLVPPTPPYGVATVGRMLVGARVKSDCDMDLVSDFSLVCLICE